MTVRQMLGLIQASLGSELEPEVLGRASGEVDEQRISSEKARRVLGWKPERTVEDALDLTAAWYRSEVLGA